MGDDGSNGKMGVFSHLFDWNRKSRKKLFANGGSLSEGKKHARKSSVDMLPNGFCVNGNDDDGTRGAPSAKKSSEYSCASSVTDDDGAGSRAPGVVARLMGLDSLPSSGVGGSSTPPPAPRSIKEGQHQEGSPKFDVGDRYIDLSCGPDLYSRQPAESKFRKMPNSHVERFGLEVLPPRSAKPIPLTQCKLLSPMKNPRFISPENAADIMEAAARMYELGLKGNSGLIARMGGSISFPMKAHEIRDGTVLPESPSRFPETSRRLPESNGTQSFESEQFDESPSVSESDSVFSSQKNLGYGGAKGKGKSCSVTSQSKVNPPKKAGLNMRESIPVKIEQNGRRLTQSSTSQFNVQQNKKQKRASSPIASGVLKLNNQKQNSTLNKGESGAQSRLPQQQVTKGSNEDAQSMRNRSSNKLQMSTTSHANKKPINVGRETASSRAFNNPRKERWADVEGKRNESVGRKEKQVQSNIVIDERVKQHKDRKKTDTDVVSFTFTSPVAKSVPASRSSCRLTGKQNKNDGSYSDASGNKGFINAKQKSSKIVGVNVINNELGISSEFKFSQLIFDDMEKSHTNGMEVHIETDSDFSGWGGKHNLDYHSDSPSTSMDCHVRDSISKQQGIESSKGCSINYEADGSDRRLPSPFSILEACFSSESCESSESCSSITGHDQEGADIAPMKELKPQDAKSGMPDWSVDTVDSIDGHNHIKSIEEELDYVRDVLLIANLHSIELIIANHPDVTIDPRIYDHLEVKKRWSSNSKVLQCGLNRKLLFDCVDECLRIKSRQQLGAGFKSRVNGMGKARGIQVAEEIHKEIMVWRSMEGWMVDELVDRDFTRHLGRCVDLETDAFETGIEIQEMVLTCLINEVVTELLVEQTNCVSFFQSPLLESKPS